MDQIFDFKAMKDAGIKFSVKYLDSDDGIPRDYEKTSEFRYIKKLVKKLNNSKFLDYFDKCRECGKLFHEPWGGSYCMKHIVNEYGCCRNHCCITKGRPLHITLCKKNETHNLFNIDSQSGDGITSDD